MHAYIGNVHIIDDEYVIVEREGTRIVDLGTDDSDEAHRRVEQTWNIYEEGGYCIPDLSTIPVIYR